MLRSLLTVGILPDTTSRPVTTYTSSRTRPPTISTATTGLIPFWADEPKEGIINARSETADEKRVFKQAWESCPCLVPSSGFYEWNAPNGGPKQPYRIHREDDPAFAMAGLWDVWEGDDETISCVTILTTDPPTTSSPLSFTTGSDSPVTMTRRLHIRPRRVRRRPGFVHPVSPKSRHQRTAPRRGLSAVSRPIRGDVLSRTA